jgi:hypothetical protein
MNHQTNILNEYDQILHCPTEILNFFDEFHQKLIREKTKSTKYDEIIVLFEKIFENKHNYDAKGLLKKFADVIKDNVIVFDRIMTKYDFVTTFVDNVKNNIRLYEHEWPAVYEWSQNIALNNKKQLLLHVPNSIFRSQDTIRFSHEVSSFDNKCIMYMHDGQYISYTGDDPVFAVIRLSKTPGDTKITITNHVEGDINTFTSRDVITMLFKKNNVFSFKWGALCHEKNLKDNTYISCIITITI